MKNEMKRKKLALRKLTVAGLNTSALGGVYGGITDASEKPPCTDDCQGGSDSCNCPTGTCNCATAPTCGTCGPQSCYTVCGITTCKPEYSNVCP